MKILAIETSCDDTSVAIVEANGGLKRPRFKILKNLVSSQIQVHAPFGGVVPNLAKREHQKNLPKILQKLKIRNWKLEIDAVAVTVGPGLEPALWTGIEFAKDLAKKLNKPLIGANHLEGHLYSFLLANKTEISNTQFLISKTFPAIALIVSGGHTILLKMDSLTKWKKLGETRDDAAGEAFDKVARLLELPYPGGPEIEKLAAEGNPQAINFPRPMLKDKNYDFSFSGLKTSVLYYLRDSKLKTKNYQLKTNVAASFQQAVVDVLVGKATRAARQFMVRSLFLSGGVAANKLLRKTLQQEAKNLGVNFLTPPFKLNTDNAAMIAASAYIRHLRKKKLPIKADASLNL